DALSRHGLHFANGLQLGIRALDNAVLYGQARARPTRPAATRARRVKPLKRALKGVVGEVEAKQFLAEYQIGVPDERLVDSPAEAVAAAASFGYPVVLKVQS